MMGLDSFGASLTKNDAAADVHVAADEGGGGDYVVKLNGVRMTKVCDYYEEPHLLPDLAVVCISMGLYDHYLFYPVYGDKVSLPGEYEGMSKVAIVCHEELSLVGKYMQRGLDLLDGWLGEADIKPWGILDMLVAPLQEQAFIKASRGKMLRLHCAAFRRYEVKYSSWPYKAFPLSRPSKSAEDHARKGRIGAEALRSSRDDLGIYFWAISQFWNTIDLLLGDDCRETLDCDFNALTYAADHVERMNSDLTRQLDGRGQAKDAVLVSRGNLLQQCVRDHVAKGGEHPLGPRMLVAAQGRKENVSTTPLLAGLVCTPCGPEQAIKDAPSSERQSHRPNAPPLCR